MKGRSDGSGFVAAIIVIGFILFIGLIIDACTPKCISSGCDNDQAEGSSYCYLHKLYSGSGSYKSKYSSHSSQNSHSKDSTSSSNSSEIKSNSNKNNYSSNPYSSYDEGYEDVYEDDDYDWDRYYSDDDYADGVDDAMDELDW